MTTWHCPVCRQILRDATCFRVEDQQHLTPTAKKDMPPRMAVNKFHSEHLAIEVFCRFQVIDVQARFQYLVYLHELSYVRGKAMEFEIRLRLPLGSTSSMWHRKGSRSGRHFGTLLYNVSDDF